MPERRLLETGEGMLADPDSTAADVTPDIASLSNCNDSLFVFFLYFLCLFFFYFVCCVFWYDIWYPLVFYLLMQVVILFVTCVFCLDSIFPLIMSHFTYTYMYNVHCTYMYTFSISKSIFLYFYQIFPPIYTRGAACGTVLCNLSSHFPRLSFSRL